MKITASEIKEIQRQIGRLGNKSIINAKFGKSPTKHALAAISLHKLSVPLKDKHFSKGSTVTAYAFQDIIGGLGVSDKDIFNAIGRSTRARGKQEMAKVLMGVLGLRIEDLSKNKNPFSGGGTVAKEVLEKIAGKIDSLNLGSVPKVATNQSRRKSKPDQDLGRKGEKFILKFERRRLIKAGRTDLAKRVKDVSQQHYGYDIFSYEISGEPRYIEVKTTRGDVDQPFYLTKNEMKVSKIHGMAYCLYRVFAFSDAKKTGGIQCLRGSLYDVTEADPLQFIAQKKPTTAWGAP